MSDLPKAADLRGLAPGITKGRSPEEYVRAMRDAAIPRLDVEVMDEVVEELRRRGYRMPEASTIASTYARIAEAHRVKGLARL